MQIGRAENVDPMENLKWSTPEIQFLVKLNASSTCLKHLDGQTLSFPTTFEHFVHVDMHECMQIVTHS